MICPIDNTEMTFSFEKLILQKHNAKYFRCPTCGLIKPEDNHLWLDEAYSSAIAATDIGLLARNISNIERLQPILSKLGSKKSKILDVGGGYGMLCRGLRDKGFDAHTIDIYCENIFAKEFEPSENFKADFLLAFEVFEHIENPVEFVRGEFEKYSPDFMIFSTLTYDADECPPQDWWYYTPDTGQHISIYHKNSIKMLGSKLGLHGISLSENLHILSKEPIPPLDQFILRRRYRPLNKIYDAITRRSRKRKSLLGSDYEAAKAKAKNKN